MNTQLHWDKYLDIAKRFKYKAKFEDSEDLIADIVLRLAEVEANNGHEPFTFPAMLRTASFVVKEYWHNLKRKPNMYSLNSDIEDGNGNKTELYQVIADDRAVDLEAWVDAKTWLLGCPKRLVDIAYKKVYGLPLDSKERQYISRYHRQELKKYQISLV